MSKIGRKPISIQDAQVEVRGHEIHYRGKKASGSYMIPAPFVVKLENNRLVIVHDDPQRMTRQEKMLWGMHRALLANKIHGVTAGFEKQVQITGLGFKAAIVGKRLELTLGFSHKIAFDIPENTVVEIDKTSQLLTIKSSDKELVGALCDRIRACRPPEPYKGTGIKLAGEKIIRKAGKAKASS
jgi:large subunit ribosomal protein L6